MTIDRGRLSDDIVSLCDSDESDSDIREGQRVVHVINLTHHDSKERQQEGQLAKK